MSLAGVSLALMALSLAVFLALLGVALGVTLRRQAPGTTISLPARMVWTLVPLVMVALVFLAVLGTGGLAG